MDIIKGISSIVFSFLMLLGLWAPESLEIGNVPTKNEGEVRVISFNVRCKDDLYGSVKTRSELIASALKQYAPDSFGVQEATEEWMNILSSGTNSYPFLHTRNIFQKFYSLKYPYDADILL